jgi:hypothetical protein
VAVLLSVPAPTLGALGRPIEITMVKSPMPCLLQVYYAGRLFDEGKAARSRELAHLESYFGQS